MDYQTILWVIFVILFLLVFVTDFYVTDHRKGQIRIRTALIWSAIWVSIALLFGVIIYFIHPNGYDKALEFVTGYLTEYSLSVDNLFVFIMIFSVMGIREKNQPRMLKLGILLSIFLRVAFILFGVELIHRFHFVIYLFGILLLYTAYKMEFMGDDEIDPSHNILYKLANKVFPIETDPEAEHFFVKKDGVRYATTLFLIFILIGSTDIVFAFDSIPAILGITQDPFIIITSNVFAVLGLISLFFALKRIIGMFRFLKRGVAFILLFVGIKMILSAWYVISIQFSLFVILATLLVSVMTSILIKEAIDEIDAESMKIADENLLKLRMLKLRNGGDE